MISTGAASKRGRDWLGGGSEEDVDEGEEGGEELTASHPWGVRPWGNFHWQGDANNDDDDDVDGEDVSLSRSPRRAAGQFGSLDDSALLSVLSWLDGRGLALLGGTCRALLVFCSHEPLWKDLLLARHGGAWRWSGGSFRNSYLALEKGAVPCRPFRVEGLFSDLLSKSWLCATARFGRSWIGADTVPRERADELSLADFVRKYEQPNRPVLLSGALSDWPLYRELQSWLARHQDTQFKVGTVRMALRDFLHYSREALDEDPLYLFDKHFGETCPDLTSMYKVPHFFAQERDLFGLLGEQERPDYRWLIAGGPCSGSAFHIDPNGTSAWNAVLSGSKKWIMAPKTVQIPGVFPNATFGEVATTISSVEWFVDFYNQLREQEVPVLECIQRPGDVIFVPHGWFHVVLNLESSVAITHNYVSESNLYHVMQFLENKPDQVSGVSESKKHELAGKFRAALAEKAPHILKNLEEREAKARMPSVWEVAKEGAEFSLFGN